MPARNTRRPKGARPGAFVCRTRHGLGLIPITATATKVATLREIAPGRQAVPREANLRIDPTREAAPGRAPVLPRTAAVTPAQARKAAAERMGPRPDGQRPAHHPYSPSSFPGGKPAPASTFPTASEAAVSG